VSALAPRRAGGYAYVADNGNGLSVIDVSTPSTPVEVGFLDTLNLSLGVAVSDRYAYLANGERGLRVIDVSTPSTPVEVGFSYTPNPAEDVAVSGGYVAVAVLSRGLAVYEDCAGALFADGFESGDTSAWSATVP
jgi:hypothetical protein